MNPRRLIGPVPVLLAALALGGCSMPRNDGHLFQRMSDAVTSIRVDEKPDQATQTAQSDKAEAPTTIAAADPVAPAPVHVRDDQVGEGRGLKVELVDALDMPTAKAAGMRAAIAMVDSQIARLAAPAEEVEPAAPAPARLIRVATAPEAPAPALRPRRFAAMPEAPVLRPVRGEPAPAGGYVARLAAFPTQAAALSAWRSMQASHGPALAGVKPRFEKVDLGARGVWVRLQAGPLPSREAAARVCRTVGVADGWCASADTLGA